MKIAFILWSLCVCLVAGGCTIAETDADHVGQQFQNGIQGRGQIVPNNPTTNSFGSEYQ